MRLWRWVVVIIAAASAMAMSSFIASAAETITSFTATIAANLDGSADIVEVIDVVSEGAEVKFGIVRALPIVVNSGLDPNFAPELTVESAARDGAPETYTVVKIGDVAKGVRIGKPDVRLSPGPHRFELRYRVSKLVSRFVDARVLVWGLTGAPLTIEKATVSIILTDAAKISGVTATAAGRPVDASRFDRPSDHEVTLRLDGPLSPKELFVATVVAETPAETLPATAPPAAGSGRPGAILRAGRKWPPLLLGPPAGEWQHPGRAHPSRRHPAPR